MLLCFECLESILLHTASLQTQSDSGSGMGQSPGHKLVGTILRGHMRPLYSALMTSCPMRLVAACLRLLTAMVMQGTTTARDIQQTFNFTYKPLSVFPNRTNRIKVSVLCTVEPLSNKGPSEMIDRDNLSIKDTCCGTMLIHRDNLSIRDKIIVSPRVSLVQKFHCISAT